MAKDEEVQRLLASLGIDADAPLANHGPTIGVTPVRQLTPEELAEREARRTRYDEREARAAARDAERRHKPGRFGRGW